MEYNPRVPVPNSDPFTRAYLECAEWCGLPDEEREALELSVAPEWDVTTLAEAQRQCAAFQEENRADLVGLNPVRCGHDFWLNRNRHGAGFWSRDYPEPIGSRLSEAAHTYSGAYVTFDASSERLHITEE